MQDRKLLTLHRCPFLGGSSDIISSMFPHRYGQYCDYGLMPLHSPVIIWNSRPKIFHPPLTLISRMRQQACRFTFYLYRESRLLFWEDLTMQPFDCQKGKTKNHWPSVDTYPKVILTVIGCSTIVLIIHSAIIDSQCIISRYNHLHPKASRPPCFWATTIHVVLGMSDIRPSGFSAFGRQFTSNWTLHWSLVCIARLTNLSVSGIFSPISTTYHMQFSKSWHFAAGLSGELSRWIHGMMQGDGHHSSEFILRIDLSFYDSYDITDSNVVSKFRL